MIRLSNSAKDTYIFCPKKYDLRYNQKLRTEIVASSLFFGSALDDAFGVMLLKKKRKLTKDEKIEVKRDPKMVLLKGLLKVTNDLDDSVYLRHDLRASFFNSDIDLKLLTKRDRERIWGLEGEEVDLEQFIEDCKQIKRNKKELCDADQLLFNRIAIYSLYRKGLMIIDAYEKEIVPQIHEVFSIQEKVELPNPDGDIIVGYIDVVASFVDDPDTVYIIDNKTASKPYKSDSVVTSEQLTTYCEYKELKNAAYIVAEKNIRTREPRVRISVIRDEIPESQYEATFDVYDAVLEGIKEEDYTSNLDRDESCFAFGRMCDYYALCKHGAMKGLHSKLDLEKK